MKKVLVTGAFDGLHQGHVDFFKQAKALGDHLIVIVARDETIKRVKKRTSYNTEDSRLATVGQVSHVDTAILGHHTDPYQRIVEYLPDIIALGYDQQIFTENLKNELKKRGILVEIVRLQPYEPEQFKSSKFGYKNVVS